MVLSKIYKMLQKLVAVMIIENISSNIVWSAVAHEFNTVRNMALHYFRLRYVVRFANERFLRKEILRN